MNEHLHITIWGLGNVGTSLLNVLATKTTHRLSVITSSDFTSENIPSYATLAELGSTDIIIVCVPDDRVIESVREAKNHATYTAHTSGSISLIDTQTNSGVFYPFQTDENNPTIYLFFLVYVLPNKVFVFLMGLTNTLLSYRHLYIVVSFLIEILLIYYQNLVLQVLLHHSVLLNNQSNGM